MGEVANRRVWVVEQRENGEWTPVCATVWWREANQYVETKSSVLRKELRVAEYAPQPVLTGELGRKPPQSDCTEGQ